MSTIFQFTQFQSTNLHSINKFKNFLNNFTTKFYKVERYMTKAKIYMVRDSQVIQNLVKINEKVFNLLPLTSREALGGLVMVFKDNLK